MFRKRLVQSLFVLNCVALALILLWAFVAPNDQIALMPSKPFFGARGASIRFVPSMPAEPRAPGPWLITLDGAGVRWAYATEPEQLNDVTSTGWSIQGFGMSSSRPQFFMAAMSLITNERLAWGFDFIGLAAEATEFDVYPLPNSEFGPPASAARGASSSMKLSGSVRSGAAYKVSLPMWFLALLLAIAPARRMLVARRSLHRFRRGQCERCGYDLRQATSDRCPECGTPHAFGPGSGRSP